MNRRREFLPRLIALLGCVSGWLPKDAPGTETNAPYKIEIGQLLGERERWQSNRVELRGFCSRLFEEGVVKEAVLAEQPERIRDFALWIDFLNSPKIANPANPAMGGWVRVVGTIRTSGTRYFGHVSKCRAEITDIELYEPISGPVKAGESAWSGELQAGKELQARSFKIQFERFYVALDTEAHTQERIDKAIEARFTPQGTNGMRFLHGDYSTRIIIGAMRDVVEAHTGVTLEPPACVFFNDRLQQVSVRGTPEQCEAVKRCLEELGCKPEEVPLKKTAQ